MGSTVSIPWALLEEEWVVMKWMEKFLGKGKRSQRPRCGAIVAAAGSSSRMGGENKLMLPLAGIPVLARTLMALDRSELVDEIVVATREEDLLAVADLCKLYALSKPVKIIRGGRDQAGVRSGGIHGVRGGRCLFGSSRRRPPPGGT